MRRILPLLAICSLLAAPLCAQGPQPWAKAKLDASPRHQEWVTVKNGARSIHCFVVYPEVKDKAPAVLLIHEIFGLSDWARDAADQVAAAGYIAIAPDLITGMGPGGGDTESFTGTSMVTKAVSSLPADQVTGDLDAAANYIAQVPACNGELFVAGFCWGGGKSFSYATHRHDLKAAFVFYGSAPEDLASIACPVYGFYAQNDARISATVPQTTTDMKQAGKTYESVIYEGAGHGFMRAGEDPAGSPANKKAHDDGWVRWLGLMKQAS
jgi:carboxymethylenebutenolidase